MAKTSTVIFGIIFTLLGILGFTSNPLIGANALFVADTMHNLMHIVLGAIFLAVAYWWSEHAILWLKIIGAALFFLGLIGILTTPAVGGSLLGIVDTNGASNWFHLIAGIVIFGAGMYGKNDTETMFPPPQSRFA